MCISKFQVLNYKSYRDSTEVELKPGFNVITGQNSAGKTALLEALTLQFPSNPHRSIRAIPAPGVLPGEVTAARVTFVISGKDLLLSLRSMAPNATYHFPANNLYETQVSIERRLLEIIGMPDLSISVRLDRRPTGEAWEVEGPSFLGLYNPAVNPQNNMQLCYSVAVTASGLTSSRWRADARCSYPVECMRTTY
jgi:hypothetical protein